MKKYVLLWAAVLISIFFSNGVWASDPEKLSIPEQPAHPALATATETSGVMSKDKAGNFMPPESIQKQKILHAPSDAAPEPVERLEDRGFNPPAEKE